jgi:hypothetical protein
MSKSTVEQALDYVRKFAHQCPGSFDLDEGIKCYLAGYNAAGDRIVKLEAEKRSPKQQEENMKNKYVIVRTYAMGVFAGELQPESTETLKVLCNARRLWFWSGAASLSQLAIEGVKNPEACKFPCEVSRVELTSPQGFEILDVTPEARESIAGVKIWEK